MHNKNHLKKFKKFTSAFGLIEIMIASTLLSIGLLGAASIQSQSLNITTDSSLRETAIRMINQLSNFILTMENTVDNPELQTMISASSTDTACNNPNDCSPGNFYASLLAGWRSSVKLLLNGQGCLCLNASTGPDINPSIRVAIQWINLSGAVRQEFIDNQIVSSITSPTLTGILPCSTVTSVNNAGCSPFISLP